MRMATIRIGGMLIVISFAAAAQKLVPQSQETCSVAHSTTVNWSQFHFDSCHTGYNPYETILGPDNVGNLVLAWKYQIASDDSIRSSPAVVDGSVFFGGEGDGDVYAVDARTGAGRWIWYGDGVQAGSPAVAYGRVYEADYDHRRIQVFDAWNGHHLESWGLDIPSDVTIANSEIYVSSSEGGFSHDGHVYALDAITGEISWSSFLYNGNLNSPAVSNLKAYATCNPGPGANAFFTVCARDASNGDILWWFAPTGRWDFYPVSVSSDVVYGGFSSQDHNQVSSYAYALDATTGASIWQQTLTPKLGDGTKAFVQTTPAVANGLVYIGMADTLNDSYGYMYAIDARTGAIRWTYATPAGIYSSAAVANGVVYFGSDDKNIYALDAITGALLWKYATDGKVISSPAVVNGMLFVGSYSRYMYAFHLPDQ